MAKKDSFSRIRKIHVINNLVTPTKSSIQSPRENEAAEKFQAFLSIWQRKQRNEILYEK